jgi:hypothetical protein
MSNKTVIANPPSLEAAQAHMQEVLADKPRKFMVTPLVRDAVGNAMSRPHYDDSMKFLMGGKITGSKLADGYALAQQIVEWEVELGSIALQSALERGDILLNDIVKRIPAELRKLGFGVEGWTCTGFLLERIENDLSVVNG